MNRIEVVKHPKRGFTVIVDEKFADELTIDEALGVVASALFALKPMYVVDYETWLMRERVLFHKQPRPIAGLLEYRPCCKQVTV